MKRRLSFAAGTLAAFAVALAVWLRRHPFPCPYAQRFWLRPPRPFITARRLLTVLAPQSGERILEVGVGTGYYALDVAERLQSGGVLHILDVQQQMLDHTMRRATARGLTNIQTHHSDARMLPFLDGSLDGAYLVTVLGEIPDQDAALRELRRVVRPGGRVVVGETVLDPHIVRFETLRARAEKAGLCFDSRAGTPLAYFARFLVPAA